MFCAESILSSMLRKIAYIVLTDEHQLTGLGKLALACHPLHAWEEHPWNKHDFHLEIMLLWEL